MAQSPTDNLLGRLTRVQISEKNFKNDAGENIPYKRLVLSFEVHEEPVELEFKLDRKDATLLSLADVINPDLLKEQ